MLSKTQFICVAPDLTMKTTSHLSGNHKSAFNHAKDQCDWTLKQHAFDQDIQLQFHEVPVFMFHF